MSGLLAISRQFQKRRKYYLYAFIGNAVVYGIFNLLSVLFSKPIDYPLGTIFVWSMLITTFMIFGLKQMFYWNLVPVILYVFLRFILAEHEHAEAIHVNVDGYYDVRGYYEQQLYIIAGVLGAFFIVGSIMEMVTRSFRSKRSSVSAAQEEEELELWEDEEESSTYTDQRYEPIKSDDPRWS